MDEERDHLGFLAWLDRSMCAESYGATFTRRYLQVIIKFLYTQVDAFVRLRMHFKVLCHTVGRVLIA